MRDNYGHPERKTALCGATCLMVLCATFAMSASSATAQTQPGQPPQRVASGEAVVQLNQAVEAYLAKDWETAKRILHSLEARDAENAVYLYYLGLVYMGEGVGYTSMVQPDKAREAYETSGRYLRRVFEKSDPGVRPAEVALELGIAELAGKTPEEMSTAEKQARRATYEPAFEVLDTYVKDEQVGAEDPYGWFFRGVAAWRVGYFTWALGSPGEKVWYDLAAASFQKALDVVAETSAAGTPVYQWFELRVLYYQGLLQLSQRNFADSQATLNKVIESPYIKEDPQLFQNAQSLVKFAEKTSKETPDDRIKLFDRTPIGPIAVEGGFELGNGYDTNVILRGERTALPKFTDNQGDYFAGIRGWLDFSRTFTKEQLPLGESLRLGAGFDTFHVWQPNIAEYDINQYVGRFYTSWEPVKDLFLGMEYDYSYTQLGHSPFISGHRFTPSISKVWRDSPTSTSERARTDFYYSYEYRNYLDDLADLHLDRDGNYHEVGLRQKFNLFKARDLWPEYYQSRTTSKENKDGDRWLNVTVGYAYRNESTSGSEFDKYGHGFYTGLELPLPLRLMLDFRCSFDWDNYWQRSIYDVRGQERFDFIQRYELGLTYLIVARGDDANLRSLEIKVRGGVDWTLNNSNVVSRLHDSVYDYDRAVYGVKLIVGF